MKGGIYSEDKCPICGQGMRDDGRAAVRCPDHKKQMAGRFYVRFGRAIQKRFTSYEQASRFLNGLRFKTDEGTFDERDYQAANPMGFNTLAKKYIEIKERTVRPGTLTHIKRDMAKAEACFGPMNVKEIQYGEIEDFLLAQRDIASKTRHNIKANLHAFFTWLCQRRVIRKDQMPEFPELPVELGYRSTIDHATQEAVLEAVKDLAMESGNLRIWLAIKWLCTYVSIRPGELRGILEEDIDLERKIVIIKDHKTIRYIGQKPVPLLEEDVEIIRSLPRGFPKMVFFRRDTGGGGKRAGAPFGKHILYDYWKRACARVGIDGVDLYGGTRHSTMQFLRLQMSPESVKRLSLHTTNKALDRYLEINPDELREGYALTRKDSSEKVTRLPKKPG